MRAAKKPARTPSLRRRIATIVQEVEKSNHHRISRVEIARDGKIVAYLASDQSGVDDGPNEWDELLRRP